MYEYFAVFASGAFFGALATAVAFFIVQRDRDLDQGEGATEGPPRRLDLPLPPEGPPRVSRKRVRLALAEDFSQDATAIMDRR